MKNVIYINNDTMYILNGKLTRKGELKIRYQKEIKLQEGSVLNGVVIHREEVLEQLKIHKKKLRQATLVLNSSHIIIRKMNLPLLGEKDTLEVVKKEFALLEKDEDFVYDFTKSRKGRRQTIIACGVPKQFVETYIQLFKEAGIKLKRIDSGLNSLIQAIETSRTFQDKSFVFNLLEKNMLIALLFENNQYTFSNKNRLLQEPDSKGYITEIFSALSSINQFHKAQKSEHKIEKSYYIGLNEQQLEDLQGFAKVIDDGIFVQAAPNGRQVQAERCFLALGLRKAKGQINFYEALKESKKIYIRDFKWFGKILNTALLVALIAMAYAQVSQANQLLQAQITEVEQQLIDPVRLEQLNEVNELKERSERLDTAYTQLEQVLEAIRTHSIIDGDKIKTIFSVTDQVIHISNLSYQYQEKVIEISGTAHGVSETQQFITRLKSTGLFESMDYSGYTNRGDDTYSFLARGILNGGEPDETDSKR